MNSLVQRARVMALEAHGDQRYGDIPYEYHLREVAGIVRPPLSPFDGDDIVIAAAWLHDAVEDTDLTLNDIRKELGGKVARLVDCVTDEPGNNRSERKAGMYKKLSSGPWEARRLKLADRIANTKASIENPELNSMYAREFPEFIRRVGIDRQNEDLIVRLFWLYLDATEGNTIRGFLDWLGEEGSFIACGYNNPPYESVYKSNEELVREFESRKR